MKIKVELNVPESDIADLLVSAWEGGSNYWATSDDDHLPYKYGRLDEPGKLDLPVRLIDVEEAKEYTLDAEGIERGVRLMATTQPHAWAAFVTENYDCTTGDIFLQLCIFGEVIYG